jgi:hypothetical protein
MPALSVLDSLYTGFSLAAVPMFSLAAAHPEAFTALSDCYLRSPVLQAADMVVAVEALAHAAVAVVGSQAGPLGAVDNTAAVAGLASAVASFAKRAAQLTRAAIALQGQSANSLEAAAAVYFPGALVYITDALQDSLAGGLFSSLQHNLVAVVTGSSSHSSHSSTTSSSQAGASVAILAVVLARSLVQLADAMEAVGPQLLFRCLMAAPGFKIKRPADLEDSAVIVQQIEPWGNCTMHTVLGQWHLWQTHMLQTMLQVVLAFKAADAEPSAATCCHCRTAVASALAGTAAAAVAAATAEASGCAVAAAAAASSGSSSASSSSAGTGCSGSSAPCGSSSSSCSVQQVHCTQWGYLLRLQEGSPRWAAAFAAFDAKWPDWCHDALSLIARSSSVLNDSEAIEQIQQQYIDTLELCRALAAAAPLPLLCNNPGCESLARVSEAAAASKRCASCKCRYCSVACQTADWKRHKHACKRMAASGETCV